MNVRKTLLLKEVIEADNVGKACSPITRVVAMAVFRNPFAGCFEEDLSPLFDISRALGERLMEDQTNWSVPPSIMARPQLSAWMVIWNTAAP